ncbi:MAG: 16S rRNA (guanine(527)-N(7))-methyltransferase RsmG [Lachnospiraceae bacterium]|nr:16S rRNA (guanine(527)-N(7))-methyltransferase RsmG [Lachnospiraceae bacterium]
MKNDTLENSLRDFEIEYTAERLEKLERYYELLATKNKEMNLTAITEYDDVMRKHFADSLSVLAFHKFSGDDRILDLGTGGGFPGIPLKIFLPGNEFLLVDSVNKKLDFIDSVIAELDLKNIATCHGRAEDLAKDKKYREKYDVILSRAVANLSTLTELSLGFVRKGGMFVSYKGSSGRDELEAAGHAVDVMGGRVEDVKEYELPGGDRRMLLFIKKEKETPSMYPRKAGTPAKKPL